MPPKVDGEINFLDCKGVAPSGKRVFIRGAGQDSRVQSEEHPLDIRKPRELLWVRSQIADPQFMETLVAFKEKKEVVFVDAVFVC